MNRESFVDRLSAESAPWDVLIVGGGATGLGAAVDAASRGYRVALIEQSDFAKGTSSRSTKLIHGGIRYLRQGRIGLVLDSLRERGRLLHNAPHLVRRLDFVIPAYARWERPFYGAGVMLYEGLAREDDVRGSRILSRDETLRRLPGLRADGLRGGVRYQDAQFDDARLAIGLARTAADLGAVAVNYLRAERLLERGGRLCGVVGVDVESGREIEIGARAVINATGVFADALRGLDEPDGAKIVAPSQGAHVVLPRSFLPGDAALLVPRTADGRVLFAVPWQDHVVVGTTDTPVEAASLEPRPLAEEVRFILDHAARYLERAPGAGDLRSVFAGLRPLVRGTAARATSSISRDHAIEVSRSGLITITGGKWTTYRKMAEDVVDRAARVGGLEPRPSRTAALRLAGSPSEPSVDARLAAYGADAEALRELERTSPELAERLDPEGRVSAAQVVWAVRHEMARTIEDVLARRTRLLILGASASIAAAPAVGRLIARERGLDEAWERRAVEAYRLVAGRYVP